jgi:hypothetical protein
VGFMANPERDAPSSTFRGEAATRLDVGEVS